MTWPTDGLEGWEPLGTVVTTAPLRHDLPRVYAAYYFDPEHLGQFGDLVPAVTLHVGASRCQVRHVRASLEATLTQPEVFGVILLDSLVFAFAQPCSLVLRIYDDDAHTVLWEVGTAPDHAAPYLCEAENYGEQELDVANGSASLAQVSVTVIDPAQVPGDQDSGWMTHRLAVSGLADIQGRRCRLLRFISVTLGYQVIADGPAGPVQMDASYAAFTFGIRDTREVERKIRMFDEGSWADPPSGVSERSLIPDEATAGYGYDSATMTSLMRVGMPLYGLVTAVVPLGFSFDSHGDGPPVGLGGGPRLRSWQAAFDSIAWEAMTGENPFFAFRWRLAASSDPWKEIPGRYLISDVQSVPSNVVERNRVFNRALVVDRRRDVTSPYYDPGAPDTPMVNDLIEFFYIGMVPPDKEHPVLIEGISAGELARNVYDGLYSPRDPVTADPVPTGIRYDDTALLQMTTPVRIRLEEPIDDAREWLEKHIYAPTGWVPALDKDGRISPISQVPPTDLGGVVTLNDANAEPAPDWSSGQRLINVVRFSYPRDYSIEPPDPPHSPIWPELRQNLLSARDIIIEYDDPVSVARNGRQVLDLDGSAFRAIGAVDVPDTPPASPNALRAYSWRRKPVTRPTTDEIVVISGETVGPVSGDTQNEIGWQLAEARGRYLLARYAFGAPMIQVNVKRDTVPTLRAGSWVILDLSWLPDYETQRRGLVALGQVVAVGDLDCAWRRVTLEVVVPGAQS